MKWTEQNSVIRKTASTKNSPYMAVNLFFLWSTTHLEPVDPVSSAALANAMQPSPPIYHVSNRRVNYITQLSLFNNGGGHRGGIGLRIGRNLRAKPRPPSQNGLTAILIVSACVLIRSHPPAQCAPVCAGALLLRHGTLCVITADRHRFNEQLSREDVMCVSIKSRASASRATHTRLLFSCEYPRC